MNGLITALLSCALAAPLHAQTTLPADAPRQPPQAAQIPKDVSVHGERRIDEYFWLREKRNPAVIDHLKAENSWADRFFEPYAASERSLYEEMLNWVQQRDEAIPRFDRGYWYIKRNEEGKQFPILTRRKGSMDAPEEVLLDLNPLAAGRKVFNLGAFEVSDNGQLLAYTTDETGGNNYVLYVKDLQTGLLLDAPIRNVTQVAWANDSRTMYYTTFDATHRTDRLWRRDVSARSKSVQVAEERDNRFEFSLNRTRSRDWIVLTSSSLDTSEISVIDARRRAAPMIRVVHRKRGRLASLSHRSGPEGGDFYVLVNDSGPNFRLVSLPTRSAGAGPGGWTERIGHRQDVTLETADAFRDFIVLRERDKGIQQLRVFDLARGFDPANAHLIDAGAGVGAVMGIDNSDYEAHTYRFSFTSLATPPTIFDYDVGTRKLALRKTEPVLGGYEAKRYTERRITARASDGVQIPISLIWRTDLRRTGPQPLLLYGYGSYGIPMDPRFSLPRVSLLDRGAIFAIAHVRGGGDLGRRWYLDGKLGRKMNTFTDFIASAEALIALGYTEPAQLIIRGGSAGGLLMGAVTNLRPDLFTGVVSEVPFVDVINTMLDDTLPLTTNEYLEWGDPRKRDEYVTIRAYSPYDNLVGGRYPALYVRAGLNDSQVPYWEAAKYVARLRRLDTGGKPLLLHVDMEAGHGGASGRFDALREEARILTFMLSQWRLLPLPADRSPAARTTLPQP